jgi:hypothetical protein
VSNVDTPLQKSKFIVNQSEFDEMEVTGDENAAKVNMEGVKRYLTLVGGILWIAGYRWDISLATIYLTWFTHEPRVHHMKQAERMIKYLKSTIDIPLVLGGLEAPQLETSCDASLGTGPKMRSVIAMATRMSSKSGFITAKCKATQYMALSSFEGEINGYFEGFKMSAREKNIAAELEYKINSTRVITGDNEKGIQFIKGEAEGKGIRHALRRFSYMREEYLKGDIHFYWQMGEGLVVDGMTKPLDGEAFANFRRNAMGLSLLD